MSPAPSTCPASPTISSHAHERVHTHARAQPCVCVCVCVCAVVRVHACAFVHKPLGPRSLRCVAPSSFCVSAKRPSAGAGPHLRRDCAWLTTPAPRATGEAGRRAFPNHGLSVRRRADAPTFRVLHRTASHRTASHRTASHRIASHATVPCVCACIRALSRCADRALAARMGKARPTDLGVRRGVHRPFLLVQNVPACPVGSSRQGPCPAWRVLVY